MSVLLAERRMIEVLIAELSLAILAIEESSEKPNQPVRKMTRARRGLRFTQRLGTRSSGSRSARVYAK